MFIPTLGFHFPIMKNHPSFWFSLTALSCLIITAASCSDRRKGPDPQVQRRDAPTAPAVAANHPTEHAGLTAGNRVIPLASTTDDTLDVFASAAATLESVNREQAAVLTPIPDQVNRAINARIAAWKASGGNSTALSESKLELARTDFTQKIQTLSLASAETWKTAKSETLSSLESLRRAYQSVISGQNPE